MQDRNQAEYMSMKEVCNFIGVSRHTIYRWQKSGRFPKPYYLGTASPRYSRQEVMEYIENAQRKATT